MTTFDTQAHSLDCFPTCARVNKLTLQEPIKKACSGHTGKYTILVTAIETRFPFLFNYFGNLVNGQILPLKSIGNS